ncbi:Sec-independent protein translocase protein TatB [Microbulbifer sp. TYP-18]|uniref:Sec-independent protein translocase protein TatB n=1 Tax=Microbulbifer sp. TYP-18 TaxID=3230024 RepID=UPI0034C5ED42
MFDIGFFELLLVAVVGLLVIGPERLPDVVRTSTRWWSGIRRSLSQAREELEREIGADEIRRELHNERIMRELEESRREMEQTLSGTESPASESHDPSTEAEEYMPEQDEAGEELADPEYPEHWHDHGDPDLKEDPSDQQQAPAQKKESPQ